MSLEDHERRIGWLEKRNEEFQKEVSKLREVLSQLNETMAVFNVHIKHPKKNPCEEHLRSINEIYGRIRLLEVNQATVAGGRKAILAAIGVGLTGAGAIGALIAALT